MTPITILKGNMSYLEAYFRIHGIKVAQESFGKPPIDFINLDYIPKIGILTEVYEYYLNKLINFYKIQPMTELEKIDKRLLLFKEYLRYYLDSEYPLHLELGELPVSPKDVMELFNRTGFMFTTREQFTLNFDGWLLHNGYKELSELKSFPMYAMGVDPSYENGRFDRDEQGAVYWVKDPNGAWRMFNGG